MLTTADYHQAIYRPVVPESQRKPWEGSEDSYLPLLFQSRYWWIGVTLLPESEAEKQPEIAEEVLIRI